VSVETQSPVKFALVFVLVKSIDCGNLEIDIGVDISSQINGTVC
jgi:hypothetical protein